MSNENSIDGDSENEKKKKEEEGGKKMQNEFSKPINLSFFIFVS